MAQESQLRAKFSTLNVNAMEFVPTWSTSSSTTNNNQLQDTAVAASATANPPAAATTDSDQSPTGATPPSTLPITPTTNSANDSPNTTNTSSPADPMVPAAEEKVAAENGRSGQRVGGFCFILSSRH